MLHWILCCAGAVYMGYRTIESVLQLVLAVRLCNAKTWPHLRITIFYGVLWTVVCASTSIALLLEIL